MFIRIGYEIAFDLPAPTPFAFVLSVHPSRAADLVAPEKLNVEPGVSMDLYKDSFGNVVHRILAPAGRLTLTSDSVIRDSGEPDPSTPGAEQHAINELPPEVMQFLLPSRYCEVEKFLPIAWKLFGDTNPGWERASAICEWVHNHVEFGYKYANPEKTAWGVYEEKRGVCRDFQHLAVTLCRCMNIPARYVTGYLGDIGVPVDPNPMDFSAWHEIYLGGRWHTFDARHNSPKVPRIGRILMATGRDATDVALTTSFGRAPLKIFKVWTDEISDPSEASKPQTGPSIVREIQPDGGDQEVLVAGR